jgi:hypothetical protein
VESRHFPLAMALKSIKEQSKIIIFKSDVVQGSSSAEVCFCGDDSHDGLIECAKCKTMYHEVCVDWKSFPGAKGKSYKCGFCMDDPNEDGIRIWQGPISSLYEEAINDQSLVRNDNEVVLQGKGKLRKRVGAVMQASWDNIKDRVEKTAIILHQAKKDQYDRAKARIMQGGHHIVDRAAGGHVQDVPLDDRVVDFLEGLGEI